MTNANRPLPYADDVETIPADEADDIQRVVQALELILARSQAKSGQFRADVHVKTHGYAQGELRVLPNLPDELAQGLFEHDGVYPAVVRFSNAASQAQPDAIPDGRGMAIKVLGVEGDVVLADEQRGPTQDFVMINHPVFFARNVKDYLRLEQVLVQADDNSLATLQGALTGGDWNPLHWHWREMLTVARIAGQLPAHPASNTYFSMAPIRFGNYVAKYRAKPAGDRHDSYLDLVQQIGVPDRRDAIGARRNAATRRRCCSSSRCNCAPPSKRCPSKTPPSSGRKANPRIERSPTSYSRGRRSACCGSKTPTRTSRSTCGMRSPHIVPWEASTASAAGPTPSRPPGVGKKVVPSRREGRRRGWGSFFAHRYLRSSALLHVRPRRGYRGCLQCRITFRISQTPMPTRIRFAPQTLYGGRAPALARSKPTRNSG